MRASLFAYFYIVSCFFCVIQTQGYEINGIEKRDINSLTIKNGQIVLGEYSGEVERHFSDSFTGEGQIKKCSSGINLDFSDGFINYWYGIFCEEVNELTFRLQQVGEDLFLVNEFDRRKKLVGKRVGLKYAISFDWVRHRDFSWNPREESSACQSKIVRVALKERVSYVFDLSVEGKIKYESYFEKEYLPYLQINECWDGSEAERFVYKKGQKDIGELFKK